MRLVRWITLIFGILAFLVILAAGAVYLISRAMFTQHVAVVAEVPTVDLRHGNVRRGEHLVRTVVGCAGCHGANLGGRVFIDDPALGTVYAPNLTRGRGGAGSDYTDADWVRALRHGVRRDGTPLIIMPSRDFAELTDADLAAVVSYVLSVPEVSNTTPPARIAPVGRALFAMRQITLSAESIQRDKPQPSIVQPAVSVAYGRYLARVGGCMACHGAHLSGGHLEGAPSDPPAQNLTPMGDLRQWTFAQFTQTLRTGIRPDGTHLKDFMPWPSIGQMTDDELLAIYKFLKSVPPKSTGNG